MAGEKRTVGISVIASLVAMAAVLLPSAWFLVKPALAQSVAEELTGVVEQTVQKKLAPMNAGFKALLQQNIDRLRREIAILENKAHAGPLPEQDARDLIDKRIELDGQIAAITSIRQAELP
jgi:phage terminase Nu1 subunit (DNA packaging protein)